MDVGCAAFIGLYAPKTLRTMSNLGLGVCAQHRLLFAIVCKCFEPKFFKIFKKSWDNAMLEHILLVEIVPLCVRVRNCVSLPCLV